MSEEYNTTNSEEDWHAFMLIRSKCENIDFRSRSLDIIVQFGKHSLA